MTTPSPTPEYTLTATIHEARAMVAARIIDSVTVRPQTIGADTWHVWLAMRDGRTCMLRAQRGAVGEPRSFARIDTAIRAVREIGAVQATVELPPLEQEAAR